MNTTAAFQVCERLAKEHYENFPVGLFVPKNRRKYVWAIYAYARTADDFADEGRSKDESAADLKKRLDQLADWEKKLDQALAGAATDPIFVALGQTLIDLKIPDEWLRDLLTAYRMDVQKRRYADWAEVLNYCRYSANPVGRLVLAVFGYRSEELFRQSDAICTALQLANFWQDVEIDWKKDRVYLPQDEMQRCGVTEEILAAGKVTPEFSRLLQKVSAKTAQLFNQGLPLTQNVGRDLRLEMRLTWLGGTTILKKIAASNGDVFAHRPVITTVDKIQLLTRALWPQKLQELKIKEKSREEVIVGKN